MTLPLEKNPAVLDLVSYQAEPPTRAMKRAAKAPAKRTALSPHVR